MIFLFFCICLIFSVAFHPPLMQSRAQPHLPAGNCHCAPSLSLPVSLLCLPFPFPLFVLFTSVRFQFLFTLLQARHVFCVSFFFVLFSFDFSFLCMLRGCNFRPSSLSSSNQSAILLLLPPPPAHHHHHLWLLWPLLLQSECAFCASHFYCSLHTQLHFSPLLGGLFLWLHIARGPLPTSHPLAHPLPVPIC